MPPLRVLSRADVDRCLPMAAAIAAVEQAYRELSLGRVEMPVRLQVPVPEHGGTSLFMPAYAPAFSVTAVKAVSVYPGNRERGLPAVPGAVLALDSRTGLPLALLEASLLTARRTGAATGVACRHLARPGARVAAIIGAGGQARHQVDAVLAETEVAEVRIYSKSGTSAVALAQALTAPDGPAPKNRAGEPVRVRAAVTASEAVRGADVVVTATTSATPVFAGADLAPGALVSAVGSFTPEMQEVGPDALARCSRLVADSREAVRHEAGDLIQAVAAGAVTWEQVDVEIGEISAGLRPGRQAADEIIYFKSCGLAIQDVAAAAAALQAAEAAGIGTLVEL